MKDEVIFQTRSPGNPLHVYTVTATRFTVKTGVLRQERTIPLRNVQEVTVEKGLGFKVRVLSAGGEILTDRLLPGSAEALRNAIVGAPVAHAPSSKVDWSDPEQGIVGAPVAHAPSSKVDWSDPEQGKGAFLSGLAVLLVFGGFMGMIAFRQGWMFWAGLLLALATFMAAVGISRWGYLYAALFAGGFLGMVAFGQGWMFWSGVFLMIAVVIVRKIVRLRVQNPGRPHQPQSSDLHPSFVDRINASTLHMKQSTAHMKEKQTEFTVESEVIKAQSEARIAAIKAEGEARLASIKGDGALGVELTPQSSDQLQPQSSDQPRPVELTRQSPDQLQPQPSEQHPSFVDRINASTLHMEQSTAHMKEQQAELAVEREIIKAQSEARIAAIKAEGEVQSARIKADAARPANEPSWDEKLVERMRADSVRRKAEREARKNQR